MSEVEIKYQSRREEDTIFLGQQLGQLLGSGDIVLLEGELGAGKTRLVKGIARGMGIKASITSPSYTLINEYDSDPPLFHMDFYRLDSEADLLDIGFEEYLDRRGIVVIEWPGLAGNIPGANRIRIEIRIENDNLRSIIIRGENPALKELLTDVNTGD